MFRKLSRYFIAVILVAYGLTLAGCGGPGTESPGTGAIPAPLKIASDRVMASIAIPNLGTAVEHIEAIAASFAPPGEFQPGMLKMQVGGMLGDPGLIHLDGAMPLVLMVFKTDTPAEPPQVVMFMSHKEGSPYAETLAGMGMQSKVQDGALMLSQTADALATAEQALSAYHEVAAAGITSDLRISLNMGSLMDTYGGLVQSQVDQMAGMVTGMSSMGQPGAPGPASMAQIADLLKLEVKALFALLEQVDTVQYDVNLGADAIELDEIFTAKPGTAMADLLTGGPVDQNDALGLLSEPGYMTVAAQIDSKKMSSFVVKILTQLAKDPAAADFLTQELIDVYAEMGDCYSGDMAFAVRQAEGFPFASESVMAVTDEARCLELVEKGLSILAPGSGFGKMYADMGMELSVALEKDVRNHGGVAIHRIKMTFDMENVSEVEAAQVKAMLKDTELAFAKGYYLASQDPAGLDKMIDTALAGTPGGAQLRAMQLFGDGQHVYVDFDVVRLLQAAMSMIPQGMPNPMAPLLEGVTSTEPIVGAASSADGRARIQVKIPLSTFIQMAQRAQTM